jgi:dTDP-4-amino-4,6-dideoxygalactose transaminase
MGVNPGDEIIIPGFTCVVVPNAIIYLGARPVYVDIDVKTYNLEEVERKRIEIGDWFLSPVHPNLSGWEKVDYQKGMCPVSEEICNKVINLPTHTKIDEKEVKRIINFLEKNNN